MALTPHILCQLVVSVKAPDASLVGQVRDLVHVDQQLVGVPAVTGQGTEFSISRSGSSSRVSAAAPLASPHPANSIAVVVSLPAQNVAAQIMPAAN